MHRFPIIGRHHLDCIPRASIEERAIRSFADALLATDAEIGIDFDSSKRRVIFVWNPEHAGFDRTVFDARRRAGATGAAVGSDCEDSRPLLAGGLAVAF